MRLQRKAKNVVLVLGVIMFAVSLQVWAETEKYLLYDDFSNGKIADFWSIFEWGNRPTIEYVDGKNVIKGSPTTATRFHIGAGHLEWTNYEVEARIFFRGTRGDAPQDGFFIGVRYNDFLNQGYLLGFKRVARGDIVVINEYNDFVSNHNRASVNQIPIGEWFILRVRVEGNQLTAFLNDMPIIRATTDISDAPAGGLRLRNVGYDLDIDYIKVTDLTK